MQNRAYIKILNRSINRMFLDAFLIHLIKPGGALFLFKTIFRQRKAALKRNKWESEGQNIPPFMIFSITTDCNLKCKGCYAAVHHKKSSLQEISTDRIRILFEESRQLGISIILIAGGEPLLRKEIIEITKSFPEIIFPIFTNGLLIDNNITEIFQKYRNLIPVISIEGTKVQTDSRRGGGVHKIIRDKMVLLNKNRVFYGVSITVSQENYLTVTSEEYIRDITGLGCGMALFVEYVPVQEGTEHLMLSEVQSKNLIWIMEKFRKQFSSLFIAFPGDEEMFGGCLAAGRGFVHVSPYGNLEPCPFSPYSDINLSQMPLKEALNSVFLRKIRENHLELKETAGGCALWEKREWVKSLLS